jgi:hypothetical protein
MKAETKAKKVAKRVPLEDIVPVSCWDDHDEEFLSSEEKEALKGTDVAYCMRKIVNELRSRIKVLEEEAGLDMYRPSVIHMPPDGDSIVVKDEEDRDLLWGSGERTQHVKDVAIRRAREAAKKHGFDVIKANPCPILTVKERERTGKEFAADLRHGHSERQLRKAMGTAYDKYLKSYEQFLSNKELQAVRDVLQHMLDDGLIFRCSKQMLKDRHLRKAIGKEDIKAYDAVVKDPESIRLKNAQEVRAALRGLCRRKTKTAKKR